MIKKLKKLDNKKVLNILKASMLLNVFFVSLFTAGLFFDKPKHRHITKHHRMLIDKDTMKSYRKKVKESKLALELALLEEPFNKEKVSAELKQISGYTQEFQLMIHDKIIEKAATLKPSERLKLLPPHARVRQKK